METYSAGEIVAIRFTFSDLRHAKLRPALVLANAEFGDVIVCQITSSPYSSKTAVRLDPADAKGMLRESYIRPDKIFTADKSLVHMRIGALSSRQVGVVRKTLRQIFDMR